MVLEKVSWFFNVESYGILAAWDKGVRTEEEIERQKALEKEELIVEEEKEDCYMEENEEGGSI